MALRLVTMGGLRPLTALVVLVLLLGCGRNARERSPAAVALEAAEEAVALYAGDGMNVRYDIRTTTAGEDRAVIEAYAGPRDRRAGDTLEITLIVVQDRVFFVSAEGTAVTRCRPAAEAANAVQAADAFLRRWTRLAPAGEVRSRREGTRRLAYDEPERPEPATRRYADLVACSGRIRMFGVPR